MKEREDRWLFPDCVRLHLVMHGKHIGYMVVPRILWLQFLAGAEK